MNDELLRDEVNKRLTLNWLIQGAAQHAGMTSHHLVRDELDAIDPSLVSLYDEYALINLLQYWTLDAAMLIGWPPRFWRRAASHPEHLFFRHRVLSRHGGELAEAARQRGLERCKAKGFWAVRWRAFLPFEALRLTVRLATKEAAHVPALVELAKQAVTQVWGIPPHRLEAAITAKVAFGRLSKPRTFAGRVFQSGAVGYGGVVRRGDSLVVVGRGTNWYLTAKELVKGTAELICLHGLNRLTDEAYGQVVSAADGTDFEPWMLQTGGELWRRLLAVLPAERPLAEMLMHLARLPARPLETLMLAVLEEPVWASELLARLGRSDAEPDMEF